MDYRTGDLVFTVTDYFYNHGMPLQILESSVANLARPDMAVKPSNEQYYRFGRDFDSGTVEVVSDANGVALVYSRININPGHFTPHFPLTSELQWTLDGVVEQMDSLIDPHASYLDGAQGFSLSYHQSCPGAFCGAGSPPVGTLAWTSNDGVFVITPDGGLSAPGTLAVPAGLSWGYIDSNQAGDDFFAHRTGAFSGADFLMAGHFLFGPSNTLLRSGLTDYDFNQSPSALLFAGYERDAQQHERYGTGEYIEGHGDYPGLNFRYEGFDTNEASSRIGRPPLDQPGIDFTPEVNTKYYVRTAGVSGVHQATDGSYNSNPVIYGYDFTFEQFGLSFLDSENHESITDGAVEVQYPAEFTQAFKELTLTCVGEIDALELDASDLGKKSLAYWNGAILPRSMRFLAPIGDDVCNRTGDPILAMGVTTRVAHVDSLLFGEMGFFPDGQIAAANDGYPVDSRFQLPSQMLLAGPTGQADYTIHPASALYFNDESVGPAGSGFVTFAATMDVPFFEDLQIQIMTSARELSTAPFDLVGGWPDNGWRDSGGKHFFNLVDFDPGNEGWPHADVANYDAYRRPSTTEPTEYTPIAMQRFWGVIDFEYPLKWDPTARFFRSYKEQQADLMVVQVEHNVDYLSAEHIEVSFGAQYDGLPQINLSNMLFNAADQHLGGAEAFVEGVQQEVVDSIDSGLDGMAQILDNQVDELYDEIFATLDTEVLVPLYNDIGAAYTTALNDVQNGGSNLFSDFRTNKVNPILDQYLYDTTGNTASALVANIRGIRGAVGSQASVLTEVDQRLADVERALVAIAGTLYVTGSRIEIEIPAGGNFDKAVHGIIATDPSSGEREIVLNLVKAILANMLEPALADLIAEALVAGTALEAELNGLLEDADPTLDEIERIVGEVLVEVRRNREHLKDTGEIYASIDAVLANAETEIDTIADLVRTEAEEFLDGLEAYYQSVYGSTNIDEIPNPFEEYPRDEVVALLRRELEDAVGASEFIAQIQYILKQYIYDLNNSVESAIDSAFAEVNVMVKELISETVTELEKAINPMLSELGDSLGAGEIDGLAHFRGDSLIRLRLDGRFEWKVPEPLVFRAYLEYLQLDSDTPGSCSADPGEIFTEVSLGALDVSLDWLSPDMRADVGTKFGFSYDESRSIPLLPNGLGGSFEMTGGSLEYETFEINDLKAAVSFGERENYIAAGVGMVFSDYEAYGGLFLGRACNPDPIILVDPLAGDIIGTGSFTGGYAYGEVWIPISEAALGIPASCMFKISAGVGAGVFYFMEGPIYGGRMFAGASGEALCCISIKGEVDMVGVKDGDDFRFNGRGRLSGRIGACPFCLKFGKTARVTYDNSWDVDL